MSESNVEQLKEIIIQVTNEIHNKDEEKCNFKNYEDVVEFLKALAGAGLSKYFFEVLKRWPSNEMDKETLQELYRTFRGCKFVIGHLFNFPVVGNRQDFADQKSIKNSNEEFERKDEGERNEAIKMYASRNYEVNLYNEFDLDKSIENLEGDKFSFKENLIDSFEEEVRLNTKAGEIE